MIAALSVAAALPILAAEREGLNPVLNGVVTLVVLLGLLAAVVLWGRGRS